MTWFNSPYYTQNKEPFPQGSPQLKMQKLPPESWCDHEFVVLQKRGTTVEKHVIAIYDGENAIVDEVLSPLAGRVIRKTIKINDEKSAEEYNGLGQVSVRRTWGCLPDGTIFCDERGVGSMRADRRSTYTNDGRPLSLQERMSCGVTTQSQAECQFNSDGTPASTTNDTFDQEGRLRKREQTTWFAIGKPAIVEVSEYDTLGHMSVFTKTMHTVAGSPLWQEKTFYPENSTKPKKKELTVFNSKSPAESIVDTSEYHPDGSIAKHILSKLVDAAAKEADITVENPAVPAPTAKKAPKTAESLEITVENQAVTRPIASDLGSLKK